MTRVSPRDRFIDVVLPVTSGPYTYALPPGMPDAPPGSRVEVPFRRRTASGVVRGVPRQVPPNIRSRIRDVLLVEEGTPFFPSSYMGFLEWVAAYYMSTPGAVLKYAVPSGVWKGTRPRRKGERGSMERPDGPSLTGEQRAAVEAITARRDGTTLLFGVTGSGKTEIYLRLAESLPGDRMALVLVPEIALTGQMVERFEHRFGDGLEVYHSGLSMGERVRAWQRAREGRCRVLLGVRSAIFLPMDRPGLIVVDEEHSGTYKQSEGLKYSARDLAVVRGRTTGARVVLGSATPSIESYHNAREGRYALVKLTRRVAGRRLPAVELVDLKTADRATPTLSARLAGALGEAAGGGGQALLLVNRRGFAPVALCDDCGHIRKCPLCRISLTYHKRDGALKCHHCGSVLGADVCCPDCGGSTMVMLGPGTERAEEELAELYPKLKLQRMDFDTTRRKNAHAKMIRSMVSGRSDLMLGTQMVAKGHDLPGVVLAGVVSADVLLGLPDFRSAEKAFQLFSQLSGRAGRGEIPGRVLIQSRVTDHYIFDFVRRHDYEGFFRKEIELRKELGYPPFSRLARVVLSGRRRDVFEEALVRVSALCRSFRHPGVSLLGPSPCPLERLRGRTRWHLLLKSRSAARLHAATALLTQEIDRSADMEVDVDIDPLSMM